MVKLNQISAQYIGKIMYALFLMSILETVSFFVILSPALNMTRAGSNPAASRVFTLILILFALCVWLTFQFGFAIMLLRMTRKQSVNLHHMFIGFKHFNPAGKVILSFAALLSVLTVITRFISRLVFTKIRPGFSFQAVSVQDLQDITANSEVISEFVMNSALYICLFAGILFILSVITLLHFAFVFQLHFDNPSMSIKQLFAKSAGMMRGNVLRLIVFALRAGGKQLLTAVILAVIANMIPEDKASGLSALTFIIDMIYFINLYTATIRIYLTVPVLYEDILNPKAEIEAQVQAEEEEPAFHSDF